MILGQGQAQVQLQSRWIQRQAEGKDWVKIDPLSDMTRDLRAASREGCVSASEQEVRTCRRFDLKVKNKPVAKEMEY